MMNAVEIIVPVLSAIVGYILRHVNIFGHPNGSGNGTVTAPPHTVAVPMPPGTTDLRALLMQELGVVLRSVLQSLEGGDGASAPSPKK
jgi:hypothetical protein